MYICTFLYLHCIYLCMIVIYVFTCDMMSEKIPYDIKSIILIQKRWTSYDCKMNKKTILKVYFINRKHNRNLFLAFYWHDDDPPSCKDNYLKLWLGIVRNQPTYHSQYDFYKRNYDHNVYNRAIRIITIRMKRYSLWRVLYYYNIFVLPTKNA